jgi:hypothetical protein
MTLDELLELAWRGFAADLYTALPGVIVEYDAAKRMATVDPSIGQLVREQVPGLPEKESVEKPPRIYDVPVRFPGTHESVLSFPLKQGDEVELIFSMRALDPWRDRGHGAPPTDPRRHEITDCWCAPGLQHFAAVNQSWADPADVLLRHKDAEVRIAPGGDVKIKTLQGKIAIGKAGNVELLAIVNDTLSALIQATTATLLGPQKLSIVPDLIQIQMRLQQLLGSL